MTNSERLVLLRRAADEIQRVRDELRQPTVLCPHCDRGVTLDVDAARFSDDLVAITARLRSWIELIAARPPRSERVSPET